jgi:cell division protein FtsA
MASKEEIYIGIDIGTSKIATVVAKREGEDHLQVIGVGISKTTGLSKGVIHEIEETVSGLTESIEIAERMAGVEIGVASVNINGQHIVSTNSHGLVGVGRADQEIVIDDVLRAEEAARAVQISPNKSIHHVVPRVYKVDDQDGIKDPVGMKGIRLEVESHLIAVPTKDLQNLTRCTSQAGLKVHDVIVSPLASAKAVLAKRQMDLGCVLVDIGSATTGICVFEEGQVMHTAVLPVGGLHITNDIAIGLRTSIDVAEKVKIKYGHAHHKAVSEKEKIDLSEIDIREEGGDLSRRHLAEIIEARFEEILSLVYAELKKVGRESLLPAGVILTGGTAKLPGAEEKAKDILKLPVEISKPHNLFGLTDKVYDESMSCAVGLVLYSFEDALKEPQKSPGEGMLNKIIEIVRNVFKNFLP